MIRMRRRCAGDAAETPVQARIRVRIAGDGGERADHPEWSGRLLLQATQDPCLQHMLQRSKECLSQRPASDAVAPLADGKLPPKNERISLREAATLFDPPASKKSLESLAQRGSLRVWREPPSPERPDRSSRVVTTREALELYARSPTARRRLVPEGAERGRRSSDAPSGVPSLAAAPRPIRWRQSAATFTSCVVSSTTSGGWSSGCRSSWQSCASSSRSASDAPCLTRAPDTRPGGQRMSPQPASVHKPTGRLELPTPSLRGVGFRCPPFVIPLGNGLFRAVRA